MTQDEIIRMARRLAAKANACCNRSDGYEEDMFEAIKGSLALVADATKEKAAKVCEDYDAFGFGTRDKFATAIRSMK